MEEAAFHNTYPLHAEASVEIAEHYYATHITGGRFGNYNSTQTHQQMALLERLASSHSTIIRELNRKYGITKQAYTYADNVMAITQNLGKFWRDGSPVPYVSSSSISNLRKIAKIVKDNFGAIDFAHFVETRWDPVGESSDLLTGFCFRFFHDIASGLDNYAESRTRKALKKLRAFIAAPPSIHLPSPPPTDIASSASPNSTTLAETKHQPPPSTVRTAIPTYIGDSHPTNLLDHQKTMPPPPSALNTNLSTTSRPLNTFDSPPCTPSHNASFSTDISRGFSAGSFSSVRSWGRNTSFATTVADTDCSDLPNSPPDLTSTRLRNLALEPGT
ncbi:uncharacterized protein PpBr36_11307 [Pyricularia pennisetigena]|uniref:uncharacterized protein n=1 Tax=Pyricularia pennisetigena TaxID=1578925 RepID=UPI001151E256|nr:uncharacterized protein PpBr36_11307 [Pyricularia pennisetigena]TLS20571.1 hypothetical protein PpBr36_11307 [Pyricularia pennisetigena]